MRERERERDGEGEGEGERKRAGVVRRYAYGRVKSGINKTIKKERR